MSNKNNEESLWYKDAVIYQLHVKTFADSNSDGIGDFKGLTSKLDYLAELGVNTIWLLPFYPSPLRDDGYDIADYYNVNPNYGNIKDFKTFLKEAHSRGLKVITELVVNHTSDQHEWFQKARRAKKGSSARDFYMWNDTPEKYQDARIIFKDFETSNWAWDNVAKAYYWHRFYSHQPDLNYDNENVHKAIAKITDFWFNMGVDGLRLDAIPYLYAREGTNCENLPETHIYLKSLRAHIEEHHPGKMLLAEANQWPEDAVSYFGTGNECNMSFHFPLMPRMYMALQMEDRFPIIDILDQTPAIPDNCQWALFLRNHDELTLEMVTDEERDYMYRVYAKDQKARINLGIRRRLAPLLGNNRRKIELMNTLLFSLPGSPIIYYGDEIGMGDNYYLGDRNGVRTPMQWSSDKNAGFSKANPQELYLPIIIEPEYHYEAINVENQENNRSSLLWWTRKLISARKKFKAFSRGSIQFIDSNNPKVLSFVREFEDEIILVVVNLSGHSQLVQLNLSQFTDFVPEEIFSRNKFPKIHDNNYILTPGAYDCYWFKLIKEKVLLENDQERVFQLQTKSDWKNMPESLKEELLEEEIIPAYLKKAFWFNKDIIESINVTECITIIEHQPFTQIFIFDVNSTDGDTESYLLPVSVGSNIVQLPTESIICEINTSNNIETIFDSFYDENLRNTLLKNIMSKNVFKGKNGEINFSYDGKTKRTLKGQELTSKMIKSNHDNTLIDFDSKLFLKISRRLEKGLSQDNEMLEFFNRNNFKSVPEIVGKMDYKSDNGNINIAVLQNYVHNEGDAWKYTLDSSSRYFDNILTEKSNSLSLNKNMFIDTDKIDLKIQNMIGVFYLEMMKKLGQITAEMHITLASSNEQSFSPDPFTMLYQRSVYQSARIKIKKAISGLRTFSNPEILNKYQDTINKIIESEEQILALIKKIIGKKFSAMKIRVHGDYTLRQFLYTGKDFTIVDFSGDTSKALSERKLKKSVVKDIAGVLRSLFYAVYISLNKYHTNKDYALMSEQADKWYQIVSSSFVGSYLKSVNELELLPHNQEDRDLLLKVFILDKMFSSLEYELNNNSELIYVPLNAISYLLKRIF